LIKIATDLGLPDRDMYENELKKVNKMKDIQLQVLFLMKKKERAIFYLSFLLFHSVKQVQIKVVILLKVEK